MKIKIKTISKASLGFIATQFVVVSIGVSIQMAPIRDDRVDAPFGLINKPFFQNMGNPIENESMEFNVYFIGATTGTSGDSAAMTFPV